MPDPMTPARLHEIQEREYKATPGPWDVNTEAGPQRREVFAGNQVLLDSMGLPDDEQSESNCEFIAHARTDIPDLLAEVARLTKALEEIERLPEQYRGSGMAANVAAEIARKALARRRTTHLKAT